MKNKLGNRTAAIEDCAREFSTLGDLTRLKICFLLCKHKELSVSKIAKLAGTSISAISHSLRALKKCHLVKSRRNFRTVYYQMDKNSHLFDIVISNLHK